MAWVLTKVGVSVWVRIRARIKARVRVNVRTRTEARVRLLLGLDLGLGLHPNSAMMSTLIVHCQWEDETAWERTVHSPSCAETKKMKSLTLHTRGFPRVSLKDCSSLLSHCLCMFVCMCMHVSVCKCVCG